MTDPEFATPKDCNPNPEPPQQINADDDPAESSLHVITIGQEYIAAIGHSLQNDLYHLKGRLRMCKDTQALPLNRLSEYWSACVKEADHEIAETKALIKMILGAESIDIKHHVNPLEEKE